MDDLRKISLENYEQLALGLGIDGEDASEAGDDGLYVSAEERSRRSMAARQALELQGMECNPAWYGLYEQLVASKWPWRVACYVAWASSPKLDRWPKTQADLATQVLGLTSDRVFTTWRRKSPDIDSTVALLQAAPMMEHRADVIRALIDSASNPSYRSNADRRLFFEMTGDHVPRSKIEIKGAASGDELGQMTTEELMAIARRGADAPEEDGVG